MLVGNWNVGRCCRIQDRRNAYRLLIVKSLGRIPHGIPHSRRVEDNTKMDINEISSEGKSRIYFNLSSAAHIGP
jgi:hypothetical protein